MPLFGGALDNKTIAEASLVGDALGHRSASTTRVYVQRIAIKRDKHSQKVLGRFAKNKRKEDQSS
jgi:hypothetical protein